MVGRDLGSGDGSGLGIGGRGVDEVLADDGDLRDGLTALSRLASSTMPLSAVLTHVAEFAVGAIPGAEGAGVTVYRDNQPTTMVASAQFVSDIDAIQYGLGEGPCITAAAHSRTVRSGSLGRDPQWPQFGPRIEHLGVHSVLSLPLVTPEGVIGAMNVFAHPEDAFDDRATELGELFAVPAAIAIQTARALSAAVQLTHHLENALTHRATIDQAIGILISRTGASAVEAFARLRSISQQENTKVAIVAKTVVDEAARRARARHH